ncbi:carboxypeptidase-like regulatory domain-containing protein [Cesiribacter sp. SM1]|uniref:carboxypeptidase-like regulatory domain-containing protein n=1 Tax=Cesiribacter sp. SM1 TaxID=2861196 RepID=UPI001CD347DC|nr:carboxypeptidase-like regulatory domain-containing protein [Cesiribacter sp. SM1]
MNTIYRKTAFFIVLTLALALPGLAQQSGLYISGAVLDADSLTPLSGATVKNISSLNALRADEDGFFNIRVRPGDTLLIQHMSYQPMKYLVPVDLKESQYALVQLLQRDPLGQNASVRPFPTQQQFDETILRMDQPNLVNRTNELDQNLEQVTNDPTNMQQYIDDYMRFQQLYVMPERSARNDFINPDRWRNFIRDWREGRFTQQGMEKLDGFPARVKDFDDQ